MNPQQKISPKLAEQLNRVSADTKVRLHVLLKGNTNQIALRKVEQLLDVPNASGTPQHLPAMNMLFGKAQIKVVSQIAEQNSVEWIDLEGDEVSIEEIID